MQKPDERAVAASETFALKRLEIKNLQKAIDSAIDIFESKGDLREAVNLVNKAWEDAGYPAKLAVNSYLNKSWLIEDLNHLKIHMTKKLHKTELAAS